MNLTKLSLQNPASLDQGVEIPEYAPQAGISRILHLGVGNFHRSHQAYYLHKLLQKKNCDWRICGAGLMPRDLAMKEALFSQDFLYTLVTQELENEEIALVGALNDFIHIPTEWEKFCDLCGREDLKIISLTITEKGYCFDNNMNLDSGNSLIKHDLSESEAPPASAIGVLAYGLKMRLQKGALPVTLLSCDNIPENGQVLKRILFQYVNLLGDQALMNYLNNSVSFPCTMVDRITPITTEEKRVYLKEKYGIEDRVPVFSEQFIQWVIEDDFRAGRPDWEFAGASFVNDVKPYELMKIRLLNGGHSALAYLSILAGYSFVDDAMNNIRIRNYIRSYMHELKTTLDPIEGVDFDDYIRDLLKRFANPAVRDRLLRLAEDGSTKILNSMIPPLQILLEKGKDISGLLTALATWIYYIHLSLENRDYEVKDPIADKLRKSAMDPVNNLKEFLSIREVFPASLAENRNFTEPLRETVRRVTDKGVTDLLRDFS